MSEAELIVRKVLHPSSIDHITRSDRYKMYICLAKHVTEISLASLTTISVRLGTYDVKVLLGQQPRSLETGLYILIQGISSEP